ncbi:MAG: SpoIIE family protein phosphatase [Lachnospiraceae bacterium]|nr:SpoIIE family protein phosphatase [Lachnospiraceae bacterium]
MMTLKGISLRAKILAIVLPFVAIIGVAFLVYSLFTTENYKMLRLSGIEKTVEFETEKVNKTIAEMERAAVVFAMAGQLAYDAQSRAFGETLAQELLRSFPVALGGGFWFTPYAFNESTHREGVYAFFDKEVSEVRLDDTFFIDDYDYHVLNWYTDIANFLAEPHQVVWTRPYIDDTGSYALMTTAGAGYFDGSGKLIALSTVDWEIEEVIANLSAIKPTEGSFVLLCVPEQNYIISNTYVMDGAGTPLDSLSWDIAAHSFELDGVAYMTFKRVMGNGWLMSVQIPENEIFAEAERQNSRFSMIIALSAALMLCTAFFLISKLINKPLRKLADGVSLLGLGNLDVSIDLSTKDELGMLAETFNKMTADLKEAIEANARDRAEKERISAELNIATQIQSSMLPCIFPAFPYREDFDIYASMQPAKEVGGDFYDFFLVDENTLAVVIADVSGKGIPAALFMVITKTLIQNTALSGKRPEVVFGIVNRMLCENNDANMFVTAFLGYLDIPTGKFTFVNAGHNPPLLKRDGEPWGWLKAKAGFVLAGDEDTFYRQHEITLQPGDELFLYTDGVTEAANNENELFTDPRLLETANSNININLPHNEFAVSIKHKIDEFADGAEQADDITILTLRYNGPDINQ